MRTLSLLRHAKSSWDDPSQGDFERPLNRRGARDGAQMGRFIAEHGLVPDLVLCSDAVRARATLTLVLSALVAEIPCVVFEPRLYLAEPAAILEVLARLDDDVAHCLVVGHNPGLHGLALAMTGAGDRKALAALALKFPTAGLAVIDLEAAHWNALKPARGRLRLFVSPRVL